MSAPEGSFPSEAMGRTTARSSRSLTVRLVAMFVLVSAFILAGAPTALAGPGCPTKPGICGPTPPHP